MSSPSILIVDDEPDNFDVIEALLPHETYRLYYANCGEDAIAALDKFDPDVILLDVMMPGLNGFEVCKQIKLMSEWQAVPIVMITALSGKEDLARCLAAGADDFLSKPVNGLELCARVNSMLRIKKQHDRIQSFSKLQRNNIYALANNLNEIRLDLAVGFPNEFNPNLNAIVDSIEYLKKNVEDLSLADTLHVLELSDRSTQRLRKLTHKFWFYLQLLLESSGSSPNQTSIPKRIIEQNIKARFAGSSTSCDLIYEIEYAKLAVSPDHAQWIFNELLDHIFETCKPSINFKIHGQIIDGAFHFSLSSHNEKSTDISSEISTFIKFNSSEDQELGIGLKIVKKIVEIYDGVLLISSVNQDEISVYMTLPLASQRLAVTGSPSIGQVGNSGSETLREQESGV